MKKVTSILLALMMIAGMLAGCSNDAGGGTQNPGGTNTQNPGGDGPSSNDGIKLDGSWPKETIMIDIAAYDTTEESFMALMDYYEYLGDHLT